MNNDVSFKRPEYIEALDRWLIVRDVCAGQHRVVDRLPYINRHDKSEENVERNNAYRERAVFKNATGHTRNGLIGLAFHKDPTLTVPKNLEYLQDNANGAGVSIYQQSQGSLERVLEAGRHGLFVDFHEDSGIGGRSVILTYTAEDVINWRTGMVDGHNVLIMVVLREMNEEPDGFGLKCTEQFRELALGEDGLYVCRVWRRKGPRGGGPLEVVEEYMPKGKSGRLKEIPFTFIGAQNNDPSIDESPLYDIAMINLGHYRNSADYEDSVFWCGQAQPWISGVDEQWLAMARREGVYVGSRSPIPVPAGETFGFAQPQPNTLVKEAMADKNQMMIELGARMVVASLTAKTATESRGDQSASTSVLAICVSNINEAYTRALGWCAQFLGVNGKTAYSVNQEFVELSADPQMITALVGLWQSGGFAKADLRGYLRKLGLIAPERTDKQIDGELQEQTDNLGLDDDEDLNDGGQPSGT
ncbi:DUF4055 domain-containing protein [Pseudomonas alliivorans]|uniref:DUF4055 domain-containing protein n=1 Tax=Pseudomonas alliivorans TaxID=2810613 RepID=UPI001AE4A81F|nr:DUF4055 domain-containing protein [Pseudomonas alliivorans]MBP0943101.1 DUF4055 domain-containing protein [Pseudomonas alliivorans]MEE4881197.1 DUF4055 domain-containing protein [Pseudomonas alliivorans]MEE4932501.1 DUF4055 domain-containing protein [Pseudomonas alliivorans]MEE4937964.1 DUF4055 domain-containing protein [Pseudomonas alliivorans]MEE4943103.1 DUF4055 domain-containing protein [Pseudomonas alliivorans]